MELIILICRANVKLELIRYIWVVKHISQIVYNSYWHALHILQMIYKQIRSYLTWQKLITEECAECSVCRVADDRWSYYRLIGIDMNVDHIPCKNNTSLSPLSTQKLYRLTLVNFEFPLELRHGNFNSVCYTN